MTTSAEIKPMGKGFIASLFQPGDLIEIRKFNHGDPRGSEWWPARDLASRHLPLKRENDDQTDIYYGFNPRKAVNGKSADDVSCFRAFVVDLDDNITMEETRNEISNSKLPYPSIIVSSGHGYHVIWVIQADEGDLRLADWTKIQKSLIRKFPHADPRIHDAPRIMRLPGFQNWKFPDKPVRASVVEINPNRCKISDFANLDPLPISDRVKAYLAATPGAIQGSGGDHHTFTVCCRVVNDFALPEAEALPLLRDWNRKCSPPWEEKELLEKIRGAAKYAKGQPGKLAGESRKTDRGGESKGKRVNFEKLASLAECCHLVEGTTEIWHDQAEIMYPIAAFRASFGLEASAWLKSPDRKSVRRENLVFSPEGAGPGQVNLWKGFQIKHSPGKIPTVISHLSHLCGGDPELARWVTAWLALPLQKPGTKLQTALVFHGVPGTGKNIFFDAYARLFSPYSCTLNQQILEGRFTDWLSRKCFILADEVVASSHQSLIKNRLKALVTSHTFQIEAKGLASREEKNVANMVFLSNNLIPLLIDEKDRRYCVINCDKIGDPDYYTAIGQELDAPHYTNPAGLRALADYLITYDVGDFWANSKPPETQAKKELADLCRMSHLRFLDLWESGEIPGIPHYTIDRHQLYVVYRAWTESSGEKGFPVHEYRFTTEASQRYEQHRTSDGRYHLVTGMYQTVNDEVISNYLSRVRKENPR